MLSLSIPLPLSPTFLSQSHSATCPPSVVQLSPRSPTLRRAVGCSAVCAAAEVAPTTVSSLYDVLGISTAASSDEIKAAYRRLARSCHPDVIGASDVFIRVRDAYSTLSDPGKRADYDRRLVIRPPTIIGGRFSGLTSSNYSGFCSSPRKNWESDQCW